MRILRPTPRQPRRTLFQGSRWKVSDAGYEVHSISRVTNEYLRAALLCPLKHPSELPAHPSLSQPYTSHALEQISKAVEEKLRQERTLLWQARNLHRQFLGDGGWMPCGVFETPEDRWIFEPRVTDDYQSAPTDQHKASRGETPTSEKDNAPQQVPSTSTSAQEGQQTQSATKNELQTAGNDVEMAEVPSASRENGQLQNDKEEIAQPKSEENDATVTDLPARPVTADDTSKEINGELHAADKRPVSTGGEQQEEMDTSKNRDGAETEVNADETEQDAEMHDGSSPEPPRRMTTRAQANAANPQEGGSPTSSVDTSTDLPTPHPLFLIPDSVRPDANFGLPAAEAEETRRLLWSYIQKQEETVRGFEHMLESLLRACRMKSDVLEWCKAEGHVGEMSDGEDWYDREKLGLAEGEDLKKGTDEDEVETVDESRTTAKRNRGRRA